MSGEGTTLKPIDAHLSRRAKLQHGLLPGLIGSHLRRAESAVFERFQRIVADQGITPSEFGILLLVYENDGLSQSDLSKAIRADRSTVVALVDRFEERKMLKRTPSPFDRRSHALRLTELGRSVMDRLIPAFTSMNVKSSAASAAKNRVCCLNCSAALPQNKSAISSR